MFVCRAKQPPMLVPDPEPVPMDSREQGWPSTVWRPVRRLQGRCGRGGEGAGAAAPGGYRGCQEASGVFISTVIQLQVTRSMMLLSSDRTFQGSIQLPPAWLRAWQEQVHRQPWARWHCQ